MAADGTKGVLQRLWARPQAAEPDPADLGTCIGLEFSLDEIAAAPPPAPPRAPAGWMEKWRTRARRAS